MNSPIKNKTLPLVISLTLPSPPVSGERTKERGPFEKNSVLLLLGASIKIDER